MESEESERVLFLPAPLMTPSLRSAYDLVKTRLSKSEAEAVIPLLLATSTT